MIDLSNKPLQCIINICTLHRKEPKKGQDRTNLNITCKFWISVVIILATLCCDKLMESDLELSSILLTYTLQKTPIPLDEIENVLKVETASEGTFTNIHTNSTTLFN